MKNKIVYLFALLILLCAGIMACRPMLFKWDTTYMSEDAIYDNKGYKSLLVWKLKVKDYTGDSKDYKYQFTLGSEFGPYKAGWRSENNAAYYDALYVVQAQTVDLELFSMLMPSKYLRNASLIIHEYAAFPVPAGKILYLGEYNLEIRERVYMENDGYTTRSNPSGRVSYITRTSINKDGAGREAALKEFQESFPKLYDRFKGDIETVRPYLFYDVFNSFTPKLKVSDTKQRWVERKNDDRCDAFFSFRGFSMHPHDTLTYSQTARPDFALPEKCVIKLQSRWKSGLKTAPYGFLLGADQDNCVHFDISASGEVRVWKILDGKKASRVYSEKKNSAVLEGDGDIRNEHAIVKQGAMLTLFINGKEVSTFKNPMDIDPKNWVVGVSVADDQTVEFNKLTISSL